MTPQRTINLNIIAEAFNIVKDRWQPFVLAGLVAAVGMGVVAVAMFFILMTIGVIGGDRPLVGILILPLMGAAYLVILTLSAVFQAGLYNMALKAVRGENVEFNDVFIATKAPLPFLLAGLVVGLATAIGMMLCYIPGIVIAGLTMFTFPLMIDKKLAPMDAIKESVNILKPQVVMASVLFLLAALIGSIGSYACYVGVFFTLPIMLMIVALCYRDLVWQSTVPAYATAGTAPATPEEPVATDYEVAQAEAELSTPASEPTPDPETIVEPEASTTPHEPAPEDTEGPDDRPPAG